jgi:hypothetical protein
VAGGDDRFDLGTAWGQTIYGDGLDMNNNAVGGNDEFHADNAQFNYLFGDGGTMIHRAKGGADLLVGGEAGNLLYGDADLMGWWAVGGNDTLIAGDVYIDWDGKVATRMRTSSTAMLVRCPVTPGAAMTG